MKTSLIIFSILSLFCLTAQAAHYAVLVAGSNTFMNYRHQSDVFHAYQLMIKHGIPADNIITFAYDDIANDPENPFPGQVFNRPNGTDVYSGVKIDYSGDDVTPQNFLAAIKGDSNTTNGKKVLKSGSLDRVFIYFADHGADGLIAFPNDYLYANDWIQALTYMSKHNMYKEMVIYIEACESGSMFDGILPDNINIYATTAANSEESSWATYCSPDDMVNGTEIGSCLGDLYSVNFLEDLDSADVKKETLLNQFTKVMKETNLSHVEKFGSMTIDREIIGNFEGNGLGDQEIDEIPVITESPREYRKTSVVNSRMVKLAYLNRRHERFQTEQTRKELMEEFESIERLDDIFNTLQTKFKLNVKGPVKNINFECLKERVTMYEEFCGKLSDYGLKYVRYISQTCNQDVNLYDYELALLDLC